MTLHLKLTRSKKSEIAEFPSVVILSAAKDLTGFLQMVECENTAFPQSFLECKSLLNSTHVEGVREVLRFAQDDIERDFIDTLTE